MPTRSPSLCMLVLAACGVLTLGGCPSAPAEPLWDPHAPYEEDLEQRVFAAVNAERTRRSLLPLKRDRELDRIARAQCDWMRTHERLTHKGRGGGEVESRFDDAGISWRRSGENVARNRHFPDAVQEAVRGWMASPGHRKNILLDAYRETGIGVIPCRETGYVYFTQVFLRRLPE